MVADIEDLKVFGVHGPSSAAQGSYIDYIKRDKDTALDAALTEARSGGRRVVLIVGDSAAGKSRSAAEAVRRDPILRHRRLVVPLSDGGLPQLAKADLWQDTVLWLDDLDKYLARGLDLGTLRRILGDDPTVVVVATMRTSQLELRQVGLADPAWWFLTDSSEVTQVDLEASFSDDERQAASARISDDKLLRALDDGVGLGEWLVAGPELMKKLDNDAGLNRAFADTIIAWYHTGLDQPLAKKDARRLWADTLPPMLRQGLLKRKPAEQKGLFKQASAWACQPVLDRQFSEQALVTKSPSGGYVAHDYVVDQTARNSHGRATPDAVWQHALMVAATGRDPYEILRRLFAVGNAAWKEQAFEFALNAMHIIAQAGDLNFRLTAAALFGEGSILYETGRHEEAIRAYDDMLARFGDSGDESVRHLVVMALVHKAAALGKMDKSRAAVRVYDQAVARFGDAPEPALREWVAEALVSKGAILGQFGQPKAAIAIADKVAARFGDAPEAALRGHVAQALYNKGVSLGQLGLSEDVVGAFDEVVARFGDAPEAALRERVATALVSMGYVLGQHDRAEDAIAAFDEVAARFSDAPEPAVREQLARALISKGRMLDGLSRSEDAVGAFDEVVARFGDVPDAALREHVGTALVNKGIILGRLHLFDKAVGAFDEVVARFGDAPEAALREAVGKALVNKGVALDRLCRLSDAVAALDEMMARLGDAPEPALRNLVVLAQQMKSEIEQGRGFLFPGEHD